MDKKDYEELGYQHARNGDKRLFAVDAASWKARAYWRGVRRHMAEEADAALVELKDKKAITRPRNPGKALHGIDLSRMASNTKGWPIGAQEHALRLAADLNQEASVRRRARLSRSLVRLQMRYAVKNPAPKIWVDELVK